VAELEAQSGQPGPSGSETRDELTQSLEELEALLKAKVEDLETRNTELEQRVESAEQTLASSLEERERAESEVQRVVDVLDVKIYDLNDLRQSLAKLINK
ncbi:unnamed protein product, partial [Coregonus sp. 'balchen']